MLYTRRGDDGTSGLFGIKDRFPKNSPLFDALGSVDELNALLGMCRARAESDRSEHHPSAHARHPLNIPALVRDIQEHLFHIQAGLAGSPKDITQDHIDALERTIEEIELHIEKPHSFIMSGATELAAYFEYARAVSRRVERTVLAASTTHVVSLPARVYLNRLSSLLFALGRYVTMIAEAHELSPSYE